MCGFLLCTEEEGREVGEKKEEEEEEEGSGDDGSGRVYDNGGQQQQQQHQQRQHSCETSCNEKNVEDMGAKGEFDTANADIALHFDEASREQFGARLAECLNIADAKDKAPSLYVVLLQSLSPQLALSEVSAALASNAELLKLRSAATSPPPSLDSCAQEKASGALRHMNDRWIKDNVDLGGKCLLLK